MEPDSVFAYVLFVGFAASTVNVMWDNIAAGYRWVIEHRA
jgi:hypothetical protein